MAIDPLILLPAAGIAVLIVILYIRLVSGRRDALLTPEGVATFLQMQDPERDIIRSVISEDAKYALVHWRGDDDIALVRSFGDKLVLQPLDISDLSKCAWDTDGRHLKIPRQGIAFPPINFSPAATDRRTVEALIKGETDAAA